MNTRASFLLLLLLQLVLSSAQQSCTGRGQCASGLECRQNKICETPIYTPPADVTNFQYISVIQGRGTISPFTNATITTIGVVTAVQFSSSGNSYYIQDIYADDDELTSEGLYLFRPRNAENASDPSVGDVVQVSGRVVEFARNTYDLPLTEILFGNLIVTKRDANVQVDAVVFDKLSKRITKYAPYNQKAEKPRVNLVTSNYICKSIMESAACYYEAHEGMKVKIVNGVTTDPERRFNEIGVVSCASLSDSDIEKCTAPFTVNRRNFYGNVMAVEDDLLFKGDRDLKVGTIIDDFDAIISYTFGIYKVFNINPLVRKAGTVANKRNRQPKACVRGMPPRNTIRISSWNILNRDPKDSNKSFEVIASDIAKYHACPDIINLQEVGDNDGPSNTNITSASETLGKITELLKNSSYCGNPYEFSEIAPEDDQDGGLPGENIRVAFIFRTDRVNLMKGIPKGDATTAVKYDTKKKQLTLNPGRIDPSAFEGSRKSIAAQFTISNKMQNGYRGKQRSIIVVNNHWNSKFGDDPLFGSRQPPLQVSQEERFNHSNAIKEFIQSIPMNVPVAVVGDLNDFQFSKPVKQLKMKNLWFDIPKNQRFSYNFQHRYQVLDHILVRKQAMRCVDFCPVHTSTLQSYFSEDNISDHDALVALCTLTGRRK